MTRDDTPEIKAALAPPSTSLAEVAYRKLQNDILECAFLPGERLTEATAMERLELGKTPVREALQRLVSDELVLVSPRQGYQVAPITLRAVEELFGLRAIIEPAAVALATPNLEHTDLQRLEALSHTPYVANDIESTRAFVRVNKEFHVLIARASGNRRLSDMVAKLLTETQRLIHFGMLLEPRSEEAVREHERLMEALLSRNQERARTTAESQIRATERMVIAGLMRRSELRDAPILG